MRGKIKKSFNCPIYEVCFSVFREKFHGVGGSHKKINFCFFFAARFISSRPHQNVYFSLGRATPRFAAIHPTEISIKSGREKEIFELRNRSVRRTNCAMV